MSLKIIKYIPLKQRCQLSPSLFNVYIDEIIQEWQMTLKHILCLTNVHLTLLFTDDQVIITNSEDTLQMAVH